MKLRCSRPKDEQIMGRGRRPRTGGEPLPPAPIRAHAIEGLRFVRDEHVLAGGSRERLLTRFAKGRFAEANATISPQFTRWVIPGSRLLPMLSGRARRWIPNRVWSFRHGPKRLPSRPWACDGEFLTTTRTRTSAYTP